MKITQNTTRFYASITQEPNTKEAAPNTGNSRIRVIQNTPTYVSYDCPYDFAYKKDKLLKANDEIADE